MTLRERLLQNPAKPVGSLTLPEHGGVTVFLRRWSLADRLRLTAATDDKSEPARRTAEILRLCLCDEQGVQLFPEGDDGVYQIAGDAVERIIDAAFKENGFGGEQKKTT